MRFLFLLPLILAAGCVCVCFSVKDDKSTGEAYGAYAIDIKECPSTICPTELYEKIAERLGSKLQRPEQGLDVNDGGMMVMHIDISITETEQLREWAYLSAIGLGWVWPLFEVKDYEFNIKISCGNNNESVGSRVRKTFSFCMQPMGYLPMLFTDISVVGENFGGWSNGDAAVEEFVLDTIAARIESKLTEEFYDSCSIE